MNGFLRWGIEFMGVELRNGPASEYCDIGDRKELDRAMKITSRNSRDKVK